MDSIIHAILIRGGVFIVKSLPVYLLRTIDFSVSAFVIIFLNLLKSSKKKKKKKKKNTAEDSSLVFNYQDN